MKHEKDGRRPKIHGNLLSMVLQRALSKGGESEVFKVAKECVSGLTADQIIAIAKNRAYLEGNTVDGLAFKNIIKKI